MNEALRFRPATARDLPTIDRIERECFDGPWAAAIYQAELRRQTSTVELAAFERRPDRVVGVSCSWIVAGECHLLRVLTHPSARHRGVGTGLVERILERARRARCEAVTLEVASQNEAAIALYQRTGFREVGRRPGYYKRPPDDAVLMTLDL